MLLFYSQVLWEFLGLRDLQVRNDEATLTLFAQLPITQVAFRMKLHVKVRAQ